MSSKKQPCNGTPKQAEDALSAGKPCLNSLEKKSVESLENSLCAVRELSAARLDAKLSVARLTGVARELRELIKVMSVYGC